MNYIHYVYQYDDHGEGIGMYLIYDEHNKFIGKRRSIYIKKREIKNCKGKSKINKNNNKSIKNMRNKPKI